MTLGRAANDEPLIDKVEAGQVTQYKNASKPLETVSTPVRIA